MVGRSAPDPFWRVRGHCRSDADAYQHGHTSGTLETMAEYDFFATLREELNQIEREADGPGVHDAVRDFAQATGTTEARALAAFWRASKRHGESLEAFATEVREQREREIATRGAHA